MNKDKYALDQHINNNSPIVFGCMGLGGTWDNTPINTSDISLAHNVVDAAIDCGITLFDHADIYTKAKPNKYLVKY